MVNDTILYGRVRQDDFFLYREVVVPEWLGIQLSNNYLLSEPEWRAIGIQMSQGWMNYDLSDECTILKFRKAHGTEPNGSFTNGWTPPNESEMESSYVYR
eukprot:UN04431